MLSLKCMKMQTYCYIVPCTYKCDLSCSSAWGVANQVNHSFLNFGKTITLPFIATYRGLSSLLISAVIFTNMDWIFSNIQYYHYWRASGTLYIRFHPCFHYCTFETFIFLCFHILHWLFDTFIVFVLIISICYRRGIIQRGGIFAALWYKMGLAGFYSTNCCWHCRKLAGSALVSS